MPVAKGCLVQQQNFSQWFGVALRYYNVTETRLKGILFDRPRKAELGVSRRTKRAGILGDRL